MWPVHTWLPDAATESRPATAVLLVGVLDKVGTYGMIRFCLQLFPEASRWATPVVITLAVVSVVYGALLAIGQTDMMRLIAFTSISHFGFIVLGIFAMTTVGGAGSTLYMVNHGFSTAALFLIAGDDGRPPRQQADPRLRWLATGHPGPRRDVPRGRAVRPGAARAWRVRRGVPRPGRDVPAIPRPAVIATFGIILAALYILLMYKRVVTGPEAELRRGRAPRDLSVREKLGRGPADRRLPPARLLPEARAGHRQPGRGPDAAASSASSTPRRRTPPGARSERRSPRCPRVRPSTSTTARPAAPHRVRAPSSGCSSRPSRRAGDRYPVQVWLITLIG